jgi:CheY-like chemotaxis protein
MDGDREFCLAAGMDDYVTKPFTPVQIQTILNRWC